MQLAQTSLDLPLFTFTRFANRGTLISAMLQCVEISPFRKMRALVADPPGGK
jgi:hypothetical protein